MIFAEVIGTIVTPIQHPTLDGKRILYLRLLDPTGALRYPPTRPE